ncbi:MAG TPA: phage tail protein [Pyrinomonadaceae bacterium]|nr:phage tail protein [Pyrinomonadaceae bacterium]
MAAAPGGGAFVLDRANSRYWLLDRFFNVVAAAPSSPPAAAQEREEFFAPEDGSEQAHGEVCRSEGVQLTAEAAMPLDVTDPIAIETLPGGDVLILDGNPDEPAPPVLRFSRIHRFREGRRVGQFVTTEAVLARIEEDGEPFKLLAHDFAFAAAKDERKRGLLGRLYVADRGGNQTYVFELREGEGGQLTLGALPDYLPMRLFGGKAVVAAGGKAFYDFGDRWIPLVKQPRPRFTPEAVIFTPLNDAGLGTEELLARGLRNAFDGREPDCTWHRLFIDACIPPGTEVQVWSRAANEQRELALAAWMPEPRLYLRAKGSELPAAPAPPAADGAGTWELLFQNARGRYLQLQLRLVGNGRSSPRLHALRAYYPRFSYLTNYLPAVYREDSGSASFLDRFLSNVEGFFTTIEDKVAAAQALLDPRTAPAEALDWLAAWFGVALDPAWGTAKRRLFIRHAAEFFELRGTVRGIETALRLVLEDCVDESVFEEEDPERRRPSGIRLVERFRTRRTPAVVLGDPTDFQGTPAGLRTTRWLAAQQPAAPAASAQPGAFEGETAGCRCAGKKKAKGETAAAAALDAEGERAVAEERAGWQRFLATRYVNFEAMNSAYAQSQVPPVTSFADVRLPADAPPSGAPRTDWQQWLAASSAAGASVVRSLWQDFLKRRYGQALAMNRAHGTRWSSFAAVSLPDGAPKRNAPLNDWQQFTGVVLQMHRTAHRFTVLLPMPRAFYEDARAHKERRALAERVTNLEKPPHTAFDVKFYWDAFRLGEARLGSGTFIDAGSRAPQLIQPAVLGRTYVAESYLAPSHPQSVADRRVLGRDELGAGSQPSERSNRHGTV